LERTEDWSETSETQAATKLSSQPGAHTQHQRTEARQYKKTKVTKVTAREKKMMQPKKQSSNIVISAFAARAAAGTHTLKQLPDVLLHLQLLRTSKPARKHVDQQHANVQ